MPINSRAKGARGERQWRDELRANGYEARRGQQFSGSPDSPDVVCSDLPWAHFEIKAVERLNIDSAMAQAKRDCGRKVPVVAHRQNFGSWLVTMDAEWLGGVADGLLAGGCFFSQQLGKRLSLRDAMEMAIREANGRAAFVIHGRNGSRLATMKADTFFGLLRGDIKGVVLKAITEAGNHFEI